MNIQNMLDKEAQLSNAGKHNSDERLKLLTAIRLKRKHPEPFCFGEDDCSTSMLSMCPWRMDCGVEPGEKL